MQEELEPTENIVQNIVPSKPFENYADIEFLAAKAKGRVERIQVDICDGEYVKNVSWPFTEISKKNFLTWSKTGIKENAGLRDLYMPQQYDLNYTADLMCLNPENYIDTLVAYGFDEIIVHWRTIRENSEQQAKILDFATNYILDLYIAVDVHTNTEEVKDFFRKYAKNYIQFFGVQVMGIENIGLQGQGFDARSSEIVKEFRSFFDNELNKDLGIQQDYQILFDGGINEENLLEIKQLGVDVFCVGHLLTEGDFVDNLKFIKKQLSLG
jgi:pentose-5-phosphate-3-epimerase